MVFIFSFFSDSTRALYQKKLAIVLREKARLDEPDSQQNGHTAPEVNGSKKSDLNKSVAEFSADEEEVNEEIEDEEQPSVVVKQSSRTATPTKSLSSKTSPLQALGQSLRQRFSGQKPEKTDRFTPTPRRSIHSYKVTETTKQTMTKSKDGVVSKETTYVKETSDSTDEAGGRSVVSVVLRKVLPGLLLVLILAALAYYISKVSFALNFGGKCVFKILILILYVLSFCFSLLTGSQKINPLTSLNPTTHTQLYIF